MIYGERVISTAALNAADIPSPDGALEKRPDAELPAIWRFAMTYRLPAAFPEDLPAFLAQAALSHWQARREVPDIGLDGQRLILWWLYQHWRHTHSEGVWERGYREHADLTRALVRSIGREIEEEESWWWQPEHEPSDEERWRRARSRSNETRDLGELYGLAADMLSRAIERRDEGAGDPLNVPLDEEDPLRAARVHAAHLLARGLANEGNRTLEAARDTAYEVAESLGY